MAKEPTSSASWHDLKVFRIVGSDSSFLPKSVVELKDLIKDGRFGDDQLVELIGVASAARPARIPIDLARLDAPFSYIERQFSPVAPAADQASRVLSLEEDKALRRELSAVLDQNEGRSNTAFEDTPEQQFSSYVEEFRASLLSRFGVGPLANLEMMSFIPPDIVSAGSIASFELSLEPQEGADLLLVWVSNIYLRGTSALKAFFVPRTARLRSKANELLDCLAASTPQASGPMGREFIERTRKIRSGFSDSNI